MASRVLAIGALYLVDGPQGPLGGAVGEACVAARAAGDVVSAATRVGLDATGRELVAALRAIGVDESTMQTDSDLPSGRRLLRGGVARIETPCAFDNLQWDGDLEGAARAADIVIADLCARRHGQSRSTMDRALLAASSAVRAADLVARPPGADDALKREWVGNLLDLAEVLVVDRVALRLILPAFPEPAEAVRRLRESAHNAAVVMLDDAEVIFAMGGAMGGATGSDMRSAPRNKALPSAAWAWRAARAVIDGTDPLTEATT